MAASTSLHISIRFQCSQKNVFSVCRPCSRTTFPSARHCSSSVLTFSSRRSDGPRRASTPSNKKKQKKSLSHKINEVDDDLDEDAFEALFIQLEEDLKNDDLSLDEDSEITEEDIINLERDLDEALKDDELLGNIESLLDEKNQELEHEARREDGAKEEKDDDDIEGVEDDDDEDDEDERPEQLKKWQLKRLAYALKTGRRKTSIKNLAADLCLDRAFVLSILRDPPPHLVLLSAALPDKPVSTISEPLSIPLEKAEDTVKTDTSEELPVHVLQQNWSAKKRIKKKQLETLEKVYGRSRRPTNAVISSIVHVTNLPRKRVVKWFEERRAEEGIPDRPCDHHLPYRRSTPKTSLL
ncbi:unnamed protein product [Cuscuta campestris]|uniref:Homeobox domain-containing protein n=1 Tax=Cuscuta campestris TaxID=132261 RepID=A0A484NEL1_9ASTE|nr:unnamed protein product [Cuscuta campestris]